MDANSNVGIASATTYYPDGRLHETIRRFPSPVRQMGEQRRVVGAVHGELPAHGDRVGGGALGVGDIEALDVLDRMGALVLGIVAEPAIARTIRFRREGPDWVIEPLASRMPAVVPTRAR